MRAQASVLFLLLLRVADVATSPPSEPVTCHSPHGTNCTVTNSYGAFPDRTICRAAAVAYPSTELDVVHIVAKATMKRTKMKVVTRSSHTIPKLACPDALDGLLISTAFLNRTLAVDAEAMTIRVQSGVSLRQIIHDAAAFRLALPYSPYWWGLTVGGMISTGAHGSSLWGNGSSVHDQLLQIKIVTPGQQEDGFVRVRTLHPTRPMEFNAAKVSLGVLGVIAEVTLQLEPLFKRSITYQLKDDTELGGEAPKFGIEHEFGDITWYPSQRKAVYRVDDRVSYTSHGDGVYDFIGFRRTLSAGLAVVRMTEETQESMGDASGKCISSRLRTALLQSFAYGLTNDGAVFKGYPVIGYHHRLQSSGTCLDGGHDALDTACPWDPRIRGEFFHQTTVSISLPRVKHFVEDIQRLIDLQPKSLCGLELYNGVLLRYVKASTALLGQDEDGIEFDFTYYRSSDPKAPRLYEDVMEEIEQMAVVKYDGRPHWRKNRNVAFAGAIGKYGSADEFLRVRREFDPSGLLSSEWSDQVLGLRSGMMVDDDGCALEGLCLCARDGHCAPRKGYLCRPGRVFREARVCSRSSHGD